MIHPKKLVLVLSVSTLFLAPVTTGFDLIGADAAFAKGGNGGGGGNSGGGGGGNSGGNGGGGNSGGNGGGKPSDSGSSASDRSQTRSAAAQPSEGGTRGGKADRRQAAQEDGSGKKPDNFASQLKGLNAAHASAQAFAKANPNSRVGRIAAYMAAMQATDALADALKDDIAKAQDAIDTLEGLSSDELFAAYPLFDPALYDNAVDLADGNPDEFERLDALKNDLTAFFAEYPADPDYDPVTGPQEYDLYVAEYGVPEQYEEDLAENAPDAEELARLESLTDEQKLEEFASTEEFDEAAWLGDIATAEGALAELNAQLTDAEKDELAALMAASGGREVTEEAREELDRLLTGKISQADAEAVEDLLAPQG